MHYRRPFTTSQRREAVREYQSFRNNVRELQDDFPPRNAAEREAFGRYQDCVRAIRAELVKADAKVDVDELNAQIELARLAVAEYVRVKYFGK